jgi:RNA polymerase sigma-70 factor, ECF subfamily
MSRSDAVDSPTPLGELDLQGSDLDLARAAAKGDAQAFEALVDRHAAELFRIALSMSSGRADAEDICQETLVGAYRGMKGFDGRSSVKTWLIRILLRQAAKVWKKNRRRATLSIDAVQTNGRGESRSMIEPQARRVDHDAAMDLMEKIQELGSDHQQVVVLREVHGMSYDQIAQTLDIPRGTVESRLFRARAELRRRLKDYGK